MELKRREEKYQSDRTVLSPDHIKHSEDMKRKLGEINDLASKIRRHMLQGATDTEIGAYAPKFKALSSELMEMHKSGALLKRMDMLDPNIGVNEGEWDIGFKSLPSIRGESLNLTFNKKGSRTNDALYKEFVRSLLY